LVAVFTKFDGQLIQESGKLNDIEDDAVKWNKAKENAEITFQGVYLPKVFNTKYPPKGYVRLEGEGDEYSTTSQLPVEHRIVHRYGHTREKLSRIN
jgi:hypothetical protein